MILNIKEITEQVSKVLPNSEVHLRCMTEKEASVIIAVLAKGKYFSASIVLSEVDNCSAEGYNVTKKIEDLVDAIVQSITDHKILE